MFIKELIKILANSIDDPKLEEACFYFIENINKVCDWDENITMDNTLHNDQEYLIQLNVIRNFLSSMGPVVKDVKIPMIRSIRMLYGWELRPAKEFIEKYVKFKE